MIAGVDEAGRGPVLGPMVVALVAMREEDITFFDRIGLKESKKISPVKRDYYARLIRERAYVASYHASPLEIDAAVLTEGDNLNKLEARIMRKLIDESPARIAIIDLPGRNADAFRSQINSTKELILENKADTNHVIVACASIIAKTERDAAIIRIKEEIGEDCGSGYPSDPRTISFLKNHTSSPLFRKSWATFR